MFGRSPRYGIVICVNHTIVECSRNTKKRGSSSSTTSSWLSVVELQNIVECLRHQQYRDSTKKNYYTIWKLFAQFIVRLDYRPNSWEDRLTLFVGHLIDFKKQSSTVKCYISAIKVVLKEDNNKISEDSYLLSSLTRACKLQNNHIKTWLP